MGFFSFSFPVSEFQKVLAVLSESDLGTSWLDSCGLDSPLTASPGVGNCLHTANSTISKLTCREKAHCTMNCLTCGELLVTRLLCDPER